jgi:hypothetical protein
MATAETARPAFSMTEVAALVVCSGAAEPEAVLDPEGELEDEPEAEDELDVPLALDDEAVYMAFSRRNGIHGRR